jgi:hypothetical protein
MPPTEITKEVTNTITRHTLVSFGLLLTIGALIWVLASGHTVVTQQIAEHQRILDRHETMIAELHSDLHLMRESLIRIEEKLGTNLGVTKRTP